MNSTEGWGGNFKTLGEMKMTPDNPYYLRNRRMSQKEVGELLEGW